ncbi:hypothetical protein ACIG47_01880 [Promicromonospora sp. NPDC052451]|uniref:hypothetical protein n=1 Tax=Promicromonospora sp. NPDC052451 TaxID=3364407 RepID=UPI0037CB454B
MGILTDYFVAASDTEAAAFLDDGVPRHALPDGHVLESKGIEPFVTLATLEEILTGRPYAEISSGVTAVTFSEDTGAVVVQVRPALLEALTGASESELDGAADAWSRTEELATDDPAPLAAFLDDLAALARIAESEGAGVYCWASP